jgi:hypothetical protein
MPFSRDPSGSAGVLRPAEIDQHHPRHPGRHVFTRAPHLDFSKNRADGDDPLGDAYEYRHFERGPLQYALETDWLASPHPESCPIGPTAIVRHEEWQQIVRQTPSRRVHDLPSPQGTTAVKPAGHKFLMQRPRRAVQAAELQVIAGGGGGGRRVARDGGGDGSSGQRKTRQAGATRRGFGIRSSSPGRDECSDFSRKDDVPSSRYPTQDT